MSDENTTNVSRGLNALTGRRNVLKGASSLAIGSLGMSSLGGGDRPAAAAPLAQDATPTARRWEQPNILFIMGDDIGWMNVDAYHRGIMEKTNPNLEQLANEGAIFNAYYAEASCTAGRANFITGQIRIRTGLTTVGQAGADVGMPAESPTLATVLKSQGYATGQFGKNHLGDLNKFLPTVHGFDEFFGYLYHLDAMQDPFSPDYPRISSTRRPAQPRPLLRQRHGRRDRGSPLGQGRHADDYRRGTAATAPDGRHQIQHGDLR